MAAASYDMITIEKNDATFDLFYDTEKVGFLEYNKNDEGILEITHTEVNPEFGGKNLGTELVNAAVEDAQKNQLKIRSVCPYAKKMIEKTPEFKDLLVE